MPIIWDAILIGISFLFAYWIRFYSELIPLIEGRGIPPLKPYLLISGFALMVWLIIFYLSGFYDTKKIYSLLDETYEVLKGIVVGTIIVLAPIFFYRAFTFSRIVMFLSCILAGILIIIGKIILRAIRSTLYHRGIGVMNACVIGGGEKAKEVIRKFKQTPMTRYKLIGQIIEEGEKGEEKLPILGDFFQIREIIENYKIGMLLITFPLSQHKKTAKILLRCSGLPVEIRFVPDPYELLTSRIGYYELDGFSLLGLKEFPLTYWNALLKRTFDILISGIFIILSTPVILVISFFVKLSSPGPLFYRQKRVGKDRKIFNIIKFRSMFINAEQFTGPIFASMEDPRVTKIGKILRKWSFDEIPQLFNVLIGNMSLVGPRPERPEFVEKFSEEIIRYFERHRVRPGITGWAQVNGFRGDTSIKERVKYDLYYIENWSFNFDIKILLRTFGATITKKNAY